MNYLYISVLAVIRSVCGILPISSSGHLRVLTVLFPSYSALASDPVLDAFFLLGTAIAIVTVFNKTLFRMAADFFRFFRRGHRKKTEYQQMLICLSLATLPLIAVIFLRDFIAAKISGLLAAGIAFLISAAFMFIADHSVPGTKTIGEMTPVSAIKTGLFQIAGAVTGVSRMGAALAAAVNMGYLRKSSVEFSLLLMLPAVIGHSIFSISGAEAAVFDPSRLGLYIVGMLVAFFVGIISIKLLQLIADRDWLVIFTLYCALMGIGTIILSFIR